MFRIIPLILFTSCAYFQYDHFFTYHNIEVSDLSRAEITNHQIAEYIDEVIQDFHIDRDLLWGLKIELYDHLINTQMALTDSVWLPDERKIKVSAFSHCVGAWSLGSVMVKIAYPAPTPELLEQLKTFNINHKIDCSWWELKQENEGRYR